MNSEIKNFKQTIKSKLIFPSNNTLNHNLLLSLPRINKNPRISIDAGAHMFSATAFGNIKAF